MLSKKQIILIAIIGFFLFISVLTLMFSTFFYCNWKTYWHPSPPANYQKTENNLTPAAICEKIESQDAKKLCFEMINNAKTREVDLTSFDLPWYKIELYGNENSDWYLAGNYTFLKKSGGNDSCYLFSRETYDNPERMKTHFKEELEKNLTVIEKRGKLPYLFFEPSSKYPLDDVYYYKALTENPYYCDKLGFCISPSVLLLDFIVDKDMCYKNAAFVWKDNSLCEKSGQKDFCYLCQALREATRE